MEIIDGKKISSFYIEKIKEKVAEFKKNFRSPLLCAILVGDNPSSISYLLSKKKACFECGIEFRDYHFDSDIIQTELEDIIVKLNLDDEVDAILLQLPLPVHLDEKKAIFKISPEKDVDGLTPYNVGAFLLGDNTAILPCTPLGILMILEHEKVRLKDLDVCVIGRSNLVGRPIANVLSCRGFDSNVTVYHSKTSNLSDKLKRFDMIIVAMGVPNFIKGDMIKKDSILIDVGINRINDATFKKGYRLVGDCDYASVSKVVAKVTPVPGGVGLLTVTALLENTLKCARNKRYKHECKV